MREQSRGFTQVLRASSIFGGVQVITILFAIFRTKAAALLLGPAGMGVVGLFTSSIDFFGAATNFGLSTSAVRSIALVSGENKEDELGRTVAIVKNLALATGFVGMVTMIIFSSLLSQLVFDSQDYQWAFIFLSITLFFNQLLASRTALLQGFRRLPLLALCTISNSVFSLLITVPLYYFFGTDGIVPALVLIAGANLLGALYFSSQLDYPQVKVAFLNSLREGREILKLGFFIGLSGLMGLGSAYILRIFINEVGSIDQVGLYSAGFAMINTYVGMVFMAMATDYFPRLSGAVSGEGGFSDVVNHQMEIAFLLLGPILCWFVVLIDPIVVFLYSGEFGAINEMLLWSALGMLFKAVGWTLGYIVLAKGSSSFFFRNELIAIAYQLALNLAGYYLMGLTGLGITFLLGYIIYSLQVMFVCYWKFPFQFDFRIVKKFLFFLLLVSLCLLCFYLLTSPLTRYSVGISLAVVASIFSFRQLNKAIDLVSKIKSRFSKGSR